MKHGVDCSYNNYTNEKEKQRFSCTSDKEIKSTFEATIKW